MRRAALRERWRWCWCPGSAPPARSPDCPLYGSVRGDGGVGPLPYHLDHSWGTQRIVPAQGPLLMANATNVTLDIDVTMVTQVVIESIRRYSASV